MLKSLHDKQQELYEPTFKLEEYKQNPTFEKWADEHNFVYSTLFPKPVVEQKRPL